MILKRETGKTHHLISGQYNCLSKFKITRPICNRFQESGAEIHQALLSQFSLLEEFLIGKLPIEN